MSRRVKFFIVTFIYSGVEFPLCLSRKKRHNRYIKSYKLYYYYCQKILFYFYILL